MNRLIIAVLLLIAPLALTSFAQNNVVGDHSKNGTRESLVKITSEIYDAGISGNKAVLEKYLSDKFLETDAMGELHDKEWNLTNFLGPGISLTYKIEEPQIREYDDVAVLYYVWAVEQKYAKPSTEPNGKAEVVTSRSRLRVTDTFIKTNGGWQLISSHRSRLKD